MEESKEIRILLNEVNFTNLCKAGYFTYPSAIYGKTDVHIYKTDMKDLVAGKIITKDIGGEVFKIVMADLQKEYIIEILKRSPVYSSIFLDII